MSQDISLLIAFFAGIFSFLSPCVLPIVPGFISYILGKSFADIQDASQIEKIKLIPLILIFIFGFSLVFVLMGASIDYFSDLIYKYKKTLNYLSGVVIIFLGLYFIGIIRIKYLDTERKIKLNNFQNKPFFPFIIGVAFAFGWSPCIGPILGSVLAIALNDTVNGTLLLSVYSLGLALPFIIVGFLMGKLILLVKSLNKYIRYFQIITGLILLITGILIFNGSIQSLGFKLNNILPSLEMLLI